VLVLLAGLSAIGGFIAVPHFLEPQLPLPLVDEHLHPFETPLLLASVLLALAGLVGARVLYADAGARAARVRGHHPALHRWLAGKYFVDELYERVLGRPLVWISDRVFLRIGDRALIDGSLHGAAALARGSAWLLARVQTGSLHVYAWLVLAGIAGALLWGWRHV
jgi:NADH-quinone oxidoreductase subunit L